MIAIIGAMEIEIAALRELLHDKKDISFAGLDITCGVIGKTDGQEVIICRCGIGKVYAAAAASALLSRYKISQVINVGVAGGVSPKLKKLDVVIADKTIQHDFDLTAGGYKKGQMDSAHNGDFFSNSRLAKSLYDIAQKTVGKEAAHIGAIVTGDKFVASKADSDELHNTFNALACDMESAAIAQVTEMYGVGFVSMRSISDGAGDNAIGDFEAFAKNAADISVKILSEYLTSK